MKAGLLKAAFLIICLVGYETSSHAQNAVVSGNTIMDQPMAENLCALTFDDGPSAYTPLLLDMLNENGVPATFFMLGEQARHFPQIVRRVIAEGHEIGNHTWSHRNLKRLTTEDQYDQIISTDRLLQSMGATPLYMRPPYGSFDERTVKIAEELGVSIILWSLDSLDWKRLPDDYSKLRSTRSTVYDAGSLRGVFLFHDIHKKTVDDLPRILADLRAGGCERFVTVSDYLKGVLDPELGMLMTRHKQAPDYRQPFEPKTQYAAGSGPVPLARCSKPWQKNEDAQPMLRLDEAHAAVLQTVPN